MGSCIKSLVLAVIIQLIIMPWWLSISGWESCRARVVTKNDKRDGKPKGESSAEVMGKKRQVGWLRGCLKWIIGCYSAGVLVIRLGNPSVEACVLEAGAKHVMTQELKSIVSPSACIHRFQSWHNVTQEEMPPEETWAQISTLMNCFYMVFSFSSLEHSGLGRYGSASRSLSSWGDK